MLAFAPNNLSPKETTNEDTTPSASPKPAGPSNAPFNAVNALPVLPVDAFNLWNDSSRGFKLLAMPINP